MEKEKGSLPLHRPNESIKSPLKPSLIVSAIVHLVLAVWVLVWGLDSLQQVSPLLAAGTVSAVLAALAQSLAQLVTRPYGVGGSALMRFFGWGFINGIATRLWLEQIRQLTIDPAVEAEKEIPLLGSVIKAVLMDQLIGTPVFTAAFIVYAAICKEFAHTRSKRFLVSCKHALRQSFYKNLAAAWTIWPLFSIAVFTVIPASLSVTAASVVNVGWTVALALMEH